jgi:hypothetical protein
VGQVECIKAWHGNTWRLIVKESKKKQKWIQRQDWALQEVNVLMCSSKMVPTAQISLTDECIKCGIFLKRNIIWA